MGPRVLVFVAMSCLVAASATAQPPAGSLAGLQDRLRRGAFVVVTNRDGEQTRRIVSSVSADGLELTVRKEARRFAEPDIALIEQRRSDNVLDGTGIGAGISAGEGGGRGDWI
jgi:hypothetical protein